MPSNIDLSNLTTYFKNFSPKKPYPSTINKSISPLSNLKYLKLLGKGANASVFLCSNKTTGKTFALKKINKKTTPVCQEIKVLNLLKNKPFVLQLFDSFEYFNHTYLSCEFLSGGDFYHHIFYKKNNFTLDDVFFYVCELVCALECLFDCKIIHGDVKGENILFDKFGHLQLVDFGYSCVVGTNWNTVVGTWEYLAPELLLGSKASHRTDYWAFGVLIYEMLFHENPFAATKIPEIKKNILHKNPNFPNDSDVNFKDLISKLLIKNPEKRLGGSSMGKGIQEIKNHQIFSNVDWDVVLRKEILPPFIPYLINDVDVSFFDDEFTCQDVE